MRRFRYEPALYCLAFILALALRLAKLGASPLSDIEAKWALQALGVAQGTQPALGSQPAYILLTTLLFYGLGAGTNFLARLVPALTGSALVLVPGLFQHRLKPRPAVLLAFLLAVEPGLVALSRQAGSGILAVTFVSSCVGPLGEPAARMGRLLRRPCTALRPYAVGGPAWPGPYLVDRPRA